MIEKLEKMLASGRDDAMLRFGLGSALFNEDRFEESVPHLDACIAHDENYSAAYKLLGKALFHLEEFERASEVFERGLSIAESRGDKQTVKEITVFQKKINKR
jgi:tetratricopeptide (TPR) repeat protein